MLRLEVVRSVQASFVSLALYVCISRRRCCVAVGTRASSVGRMRPVTSTVKKTAPMQQPVTPSATARAARATTPTYNKRFSNVKPRIYEAVEAHVKASRAAIANPVVQYQVVMGSDEPVRIVTAEGTTL